MRDNLGGIYSVFDFNINECREETTSHSRHLNRSAMRQSGVAFDIFAKARDSRSQVLPSDQFDLRSYTHLDQDNA